MILVGSATGDHVYLREPVAVFRVVGPRFYLEFLQGVDRGLEKIRRIIRIRILDAIQGEVVVFQTLAGDIESEVAAVAAGSSLGDGISRTVSSRPGNQ